MIVAVTLRFAGGEMSRSAVFDRFKGFVDIFAIFKIEYPCRWSLTGNPNVLTIRLIESGGCKGRRESPTEARSTGARGHVPAKVRIEHFITMNNNEIKRNVEDELHHGATCQRQWNWTRR